MKPVVLRLTAALFALPAVALPPQHATSAPVHRSPVQVRATTAPVQAPTMLTGQDGVLANFLQLSADQRQQWADIRLENASTLKPMLEEQRDLQRQLQAAISGGADACTIGQLTLSARRVTEQINVEQNLVDEQMSVLNADQQARYQAFLAAVTYLRQH